jgi:hypothetical protein
MTDTSDVPDVALGLRLLRAVADTDALDDVKPVDPGDLATRKQLRAWTAADVLSGFPETVGPHLAAAMRVYAMRCLGDVDDDTAPIGIGFQFMCGGDA